jgi:hypothetical protein
MFRFCPSPRGCVAGAGSQKKTWTTRCWVLRSSPHSCTQLVPHSLRSRSPRSRTMAMTVMTHPRPVSHLMQLAQLWLQQDTYLDYWTRAHTPSSATICACSFPRSRSTRSATRASRMYSHLSTKPYSATFPYSRLAPRLRTLCRGQRGGACG